MDGVEISSPLIQDLAIVLCVAAATSLLTRWLRQPLLLGYLLAGLLVGPHTSFLLFADEGGCRLVAMGLLKASAVVILFAAACGAVSRPAPAPPAPAIAVTAAPPRPARVPVPARLLETVDAALGGIRIAVHAGEVFDGRRCWTFVTEGLVRRDHPELVLSILMRDGDDPALYPTSVVLLLSALGAMVPDQQRFDPWNSATLGTGLFGRDDVIGIAAIPAEGPSGLDLPDPAVSLMPLTRDETEVARRYGAGRVAGMLGKRERFFPTVWWFDRDRPTVIADEDVGKSALADLTGKRWRGITILLDLADTMSFHGFLLRVRVQPHAVPDLVRLLRTAGPGGGTALLLLGPDELAGTRMVWEPGEELPAGIFGPPSRRASGNHLVLAVGGVDVLPRILEDGVLVRMTLAERDALVAALEAGRDHSPAITVGAERVRFEIVRTPSPTRPLLTTAFLTPIDELPRRLATGDLLLFVDEIERELIAALPAPRDLRRLEVHVTLRPGHREVEVVPASGKPDGWVRALERRIAALPEVVVAGEVVVVFSFALPLS
jgi:hypothetical protein